MSWRLDGFAASLTSVSDTTRDAYQNDVGAFVEWAGDRAGLPDRRNGPGRGNARHRLHQPILRADEASSQK